MTRLLAAVLSLAVLSCASTKPAPPVPKLSETEAFRREPDVVVAPTTPDRFAAGFTSPLACERGAREYRHRARDLAWDYLRACVLRGNFSELHVLLENWSDDLRNRPQAADLLVEVIAARSTISGDLTQLQQLGVPLFDLDSALEHPSAYIGKRVLFMGTVAHAKDVKGGTQFSISELGAGTQPIERQSTGAVGYSNSGYAPTVVTQPRGSVPSHEQTGGTHYENTRFETGREVLARMKGSDPFLTVDKPMLFIVTFTRNTKSSEEQSPEVELLGYRLLDSPWRWGSK